MKIKLIDQHANEYNIIAMNNWKKQQMIKAIINKIDSRKTGLIYIDNIYLDSALTQFLLDDERIYNVLQNQEALWIYIKYRCNRCRSHGVHKPVIYLYPKEECEINVGLNIQDAKFTFIYPPFDDNYNWTVTGRPSGEIIHHGKSLRYLFWEADGYNNIDISKGFSLHKSEVISFFEEKLTQFKLNDTEISDFITYWAPIVMKHEFVLVSFQFETYDQQFQLQISPKPDNLIRVFAVFYPLSEKLNVEPQVIPNFQRDGFTVIEWGGSIIE